jgi:hypothetical protein
LNICMNVLRKRLVGLVDVALRMNSSIERRRSERDERSFFNRYDKIVID